MDDGSLHSAPLNISRLHAATRTALLAARSPDGGWPYAAGKRSRIEPTCWALLALGHSEREAPNVDVLRVWPRHDAWVVDVAGVPPNHAFNALAALTLLQTPSAARLADPMISQLITARGVRLAASKDFRQDNSLQAWSWIDGTFSWVEPTAWCLLLLKKRRGMAALRGADERIDVGERMLFDRASSVGGWNYGSPNVYGRDLLPYVPTTALGLLALQDRRDHPVVQRSLQRLQHDLLTERSAVALALSIICLRVYGLPALLAEQALAHLFHHTRVDAGWTDNLLGLAMTLCALADSPSAPAAFTL